MKLKIAVCDDDRMFLKQFGDEKIKELLNELKIGADINYFIDGNKLLKEFENNNLYDIVILDIDMPTINGKVLARKLRAISAAFRLVFISVLGNEVFNTFQYSIDTFIPKGSTNDFFKSELARVLQKAINYKPEYHIFKAKEIIAGKESVEFFTMKFLLQDIFYFTCISRKCYLYTYNKEFRIDSNFDLLLKKYVPLGFFETARGYIVNLKHISDMCEIQLTMDNEVNLPISRRKYKQVKEAFSNMLTEAVIGNEL